MADRATFAYMQARLQAQHGRRPNKSTWRRLNASKSLGHYLENVRQTSLAPWVMHFTADSDIHMIERSLRQDWKAYIVRMQSWAPRQWRDAIIKTGELVDLERASQERLGENGEVEHVPADHPPLKTWEDDFVTMWPVTTKKDRQGLQHLLSTLHQHLSLDNPSLVRDAVEARYALIDRLERLFRIGAQGPLAVFSFIGLMALDIEHLRAHLVHRRLFPETLDIG